MIRCINKLVNLETLIILHLLRPEPIMMHQCHSGMLDGQFSPVVHLVKLHYYLLDERLRPSEKKMWWLNIG